MSKSYGFIEITGVVAAIDALDIMCKTADGAFQFSVMRPKESRCTLGNE